MEVLGSLDHVLVDGQFRVSSCDRNVENILNVDLFVSHSQGQGLETRVVCDQTSVEEASLGSVDVYHLWREEDGCSSSGENSVNHMDLFVFLLIAGDHET